MTFLSILRPNALLSTEKQMQAYRLGTAKPASHRALPGTLSFLLATALANASLLQSESALHEHKACHVVRPKHPSCLLSVVAGSEHRCGARENIQENIFAWRSLC